MLLGLYTNILETENRLTVPNEFREAFKDGLYITQGFDRNLMLLTVQAFEMIYRKITSLNIADPLARLLLRMLLASAQNTAMTPEGSIQISSTLKEFAALHADVVLVGQGDYVELWSLDLWRTQIKQLLDVEANRFATLDISTRKI